MRDEMKREERRGSWKEEKEGEMGCGVVGLWGWGLVRL